MVGIALVVASLVASSGVAQADERLTGDRVATKANTILSLGDLGLDSATTRSAAEATIGPRARKPRVWNMPVAVAQRATMSFARDVYENTTPNEFDDSGSIIGTAAWDAYTAGSCKRKSKSRVNCIGLVEAYFDVIDDGGQVVGEDTFYCIWEQTNWYPRAKQKRLKTDIPNEYCGWESDD